MALKLLTKKTGAKYVRKTILVGITYLDHTDKLLKQEQWAGTISEASPAVGIRIVRRGSAKVFVIPPARDNIRPAPPGAYRLRSTGEVIQDPDFLSVRTVVSPAPKQKSKKPASARSRKRHLSDE